MVEMKYRHLALMMMMMLVAGIPGAEQEATTQVSDVGNRV
jgi:hypothetical protein